MTRTSPLALFALLVAAPGCGSDALAPTDGGADATVPPDSAPPDGSITLDTALSPDTATPDAPPASDTAGGCTYVGMTYAVGARFPDKDGCNTCTCEAGGVVACTEIACPPRDAAPATCDFATGYSYGATGGNALYYEITTLAPGNKYTHTRKGRDSTTIASCSPALPPCGALDVITAYDIEVHDLPNADVKAALAQAQPPLYGYDPRPHDGTVFEFKRADGRGFLLGELCQGRTPCSPIPAGVAQLAKRLQDLDEQQLAKPECAAFKQ